MRRSAAVTVLASAFCLGAFAQGNFTFNSSSSSAVWENLTTGGPFIKSPAILEVAVMWSADTNAIPTTYLNGAATPTNVPSESSWVGIFTDPNFHLALDTSAGNPPIVTTCGGVGPAEGAYFGGVRYISGTSPSQTVQLYVIGWDKSYGIDPIAAANSVAPVGFSTPIKYTLGSTIIPGSGLGLAGISGFGIGVPEPSTCALASIGLSAWLIYRRRRC